MLNYFLGKVSNAQYCSSKIKCVRAKNRRGGGAFKAPPPPGSYRVNSFTPHYNNEHKNHELTRMAEPIPPSGQSSSYSLTTLSSSSSTDRHAETDRIVITTRIAFAHHFRCRLRRRESCILGATSSQPTLPLHELLPARLVIHRQTSAHERRKGTLSVQSRSGILADFCPRQH